MNGFVLETSGVCRNETFARCRAARCDEGRECCPSVDRACSTYAVAQCAHQTYPAGPVGSLAREGAEPGEWVHLGPYVV